VARVQAAGVNGMAKKRKSRSKVPTIITGAVGTYVVAAELVRQGFIVSALSQTAKGIDILAADGQSLRPVAIQVKTAGVKRDGWIMRAHHETIRAPGLFYVFVSVSGAVPDFYVVPAVTVARTIKREHAAWLQRTARDGTPHRDTPWRYFRRNGAYKDAWHLLRGKGSNGIKATPK
jgi:hypothetical protein